MMPRDLLLYVQAQPFRPFRLHLSSGRTIDVRHPEMVRVGALVVMVFTFVGGSTAVFDEWETVSLSLLEAVSHVQSTTEGLSA